MKEGLKFLELFGGISDQYIYQAARPFREQKAHVNVKRLRVMAVCAVLILVIGLGSIYHKEVKAAWERFTTMIGRILGIEEDMAGYTDIIGKSITKNGITITMEEAVMDGAELWLAYSSFAEKEQAVELILFTQVRINGESTQLDGTYSLNQEPTVDFQYEMVSRFRLENKIGNTEPANIEIQIQTMKAGGEKMIGEYDFSFIASPQELEAQTKEVSLNERLSIDNDRELKLNEFRYNILDSSIYGSLDSFRDGEEYFLIGEDNLGNPIQYSVQSYENPGITFAQDSMDFEYGRISPKAESLTLQLYVLEEKDKKPPVYQKNSDTEMDTYGEEEGRVYEEGESPTDGAVPKGREFTILIK